MPKNLSIFFCVAAWPRIKETGLINGFLDGLLMVIVITTISLIPLILIREPKGINKNKEKFNHEFDIKYLCSGKKEKILKKDVDLDLAELNKYKLICPIGAESLKYTAGLTGVQKYNGVFVEKRYLPIMHPNMAILNLN